ncbi:uncharacterized protein LTR77_002611 [Saxophila tyrrhenica]|uniref:Uncharacterized protein n=1 Tax=Saxophila tyrrhenica TaxID=1690608 RepID=A0AAV9PJP2_9PEZI|nr:hypothetical protein LTR77_002611 [Saxophila tyrrhenica]
MASSPPSPPPPWKRTSSFSSVAQSVASATEDFVLHRDPPPGFIAATAAATARAPSVKEIRSGQFGQDGWSAERSAKPGPRRRSSGSGERPNVRDSRFIEPFEPLAEERTRVSADERTSEGLRAEDGRRDHSSHAEARAATPANIPESRPLTSPDNERTDHDRIEAPEQHANPNYQTPPKLPWTTSTLIGLKAFWKWFLTPFGFLVTLYGLNVVAWGGMLFLLLCGAAPAMCWAPVHTAENQRHMSPAAALDLPGPYYHNCNDINSPRRVWIEIDSQILNALFCVTGFGLVPWRFRDLYYLLRWRLTSSKSSNKMYGLRVLAGIHRSWFRLSGSQTLDSIPSQDYLTHLQKTATPGSDLEAAHSSLPDADPRLPLPLAKTPPPPPSGIRAPATAPWKLDFFIWCQVWNTFFQCCLCGFMWGMNRYARPPWSTGLFVALACIIAGVGGWMSFKEGKAVKKVEGVMRKDQDDVAGEGEELREVRTNASEYESVHLHGQAKDILRSMG